MNKVGITPVYLRDIKSSLRDENFFGKIINRLIKKAEKEETNIIVGYYLRKPILEE